MRLILMPIPNARKNLYSWFLLGSVAVLWIMARVLVPTPAGAEMPGVPIPACPFRTLTGIPCPFCGITTGCAWMARGNLRGAWGCSILSPILMIGAFLAGVYCLVCRLGAGRKAEVQMEDMERRLLWIFALVLGAASWLVNLLRM